MHISEHKFSVKSSTQHLDFAPINVEAIIFYQDGKTLFKNVFSHKINLLIFENERGNYAKKHRCRYGWIQVHG